MKNSPLFLFQNVRYSNSPFMIKSLLIFRNLFFLGEEITSNSKAFQEKIELMLKTFLTCLCIVVAILALPTIAQANHGRAPISDIDYNGIGVFAGSYTYSTIDHPWFVFNANAGDIIQFNEILVIPV